MGLCSIGLQQLNKGYLQGPVDSCNPGTKVTHTITHIHTITRVQLLVSCFSFSSKATSKWPGPWTDRGALAAGVKRKAGYTSHGIAQWLAHMYRSHHKLYTLCSLNKSTEKIRATEKSDNSNLSTQNQHVLVEVEECSTGGNTDWRCPEWERKRITVDRISPHVSLSWVLKQAQRSQTPSF